MERIRKLSTRARGESESDAGGRRETVKEETRRGRLV